MFKLRTVLFASTLCLGIGVALADAPKEHKATGPLKGHPNLIAAETKLHAAAKSITKSQEANECVFGVEGGHGAKAKELIEAAEKQTWDAAEWVNTHDNDCKEWLKKNEKKEKGKGPAEPKLKGHPALKKHPNLIAAEKDLIAAYESIEKSQEANECVFGIEGGHGQKAKEAIDAAFKQVTEAAEWVNTHENECKEAGKKGKGDKK
jgi:hypothetical protein